MGTPILHHEVLEMLGVGSEQLTQLVDFAGEPVGDEYLASLRTGANQKFRKLALDLHPDCTKNDAKKTALYKELSESLAWLNALDLKAVALKKASDKRMAVSQDALTTLVRKVDKVDELRKKYERQAAEHKLRMAFMAATLDAKREWERKVHTVMGYAKTFLIFWFILLAYQFRHEIEAWLVGSP
jgi:hypothetical protein